MSLVEDTMTSLLSGNFGPVDHEVTGTDLPVTGAIPKELNGRLLRIGPNPVVEPTQADFHWFTGTGMVHGLRVNDGRALWYRNRYVRSDRVVEALGGPPTLGPRHGVGDNTANTNIVSIGGSTYAIVEAGGLPVLLNDGLETVCRSDFGGTLNGSFTAHPKVDPITNEVHAVTYYWEWDHLRYLVVGTDGKVRRTVQVPVPGRPMTHDCHITERYVLIFDLPCQFHLESAMAGAPLPYYWDSEYSARVGLLPRDGEPTDIFWVDLEPCYIFHVLNAHDLNDGKVLLDAVRHDRVFDRNRIAPFEAAPTLDRWILDPYTGTSKRETISERPQEFPRHDERMLGQKLRYGYTISLENSPGEIDYGQILKHDLDRGTTEVWDPGPGRVSQEPVFVARQGSTTEDDGWLMAYTYDRAMNGSSVVILAADDLAAGPIAEISLPQRVPFGFHGNWIPSKN